MSIVPSAGGSHSCWPNWRENRLFSVLLAILILVAAVWLVSVVRNNFKTWHAIGLAPVAPRTISIDGLGKVSSPPTIAQISTGVVSEGDLNIGKTQKQNTDKMNALVVALKTLGIADKDLQTANYNISPRYDYTDGKSRITGYTVSQELSVKVRDLTKVSDVFQKAGELGANQVTGPNFTIDDPETARAEARKLAIENAKQKAEVLAKSLGVKILRVATFYESSGGEPVPMMNYAKSDLGIGGGATAAPQIQSGTLDVVSNVSVTYEIE